MKGILWAIRKPHTDNIISGKKTIEVRKFIPKNLTPETPNFIYETKANGGCGKVIGEFKCDKINEYHLDIYQPFEDVRYYDIQEPDLWETCLTDDDLEEYGNGKTLYGLHITDLKIYDKPKELSKFKNLQGVQIKRPFQSWGYINV